ncbi:hypothetical protein ACGYLG_18650 [Sulfitobacter sp. MOLA879]
MAQHHAKLVDTERPINCLSQAIGKPFLFGASSLLVYVVVEAQFSAGHLANLSAIAAVFPQQEVQHPEQATMPFFDGHPGSCLHVLSARDLGNFESEFGKISRINIGMPTRSPGLFEQRAQARHTGCLMAVEDLSCSGQCLEVFKKRRRRAQKSTRTGEEICRHTLLN